MKFTILFMTLLVAVGCGKDSNSVSPTSPPSSPKSPTSESGGEELQENAPSPVKLGEQINVEVRSEQPLLGLRYSKSLKDQFDFNFMVKPSELGITESRNIAHVFIRLVSKRTNLPLTQWYFQSSLDQNKIDPAKDLFFFQPLHSETEAKIASAQLQDLAIQIAVDAKEAPESGQWYWIDLGSHCSTAPQNFMERDSIATGCF